MTDYDDMRHDHCKCGCMINWDTDWSEAKCHGCGTIYKVDCDSVLVYWLVEKLEKQTPWTTEAK